MIKQFEIIPATGYSNPRIVALDTEGQLWFATFRDVPLVKADWMKMHSPPTPPSQGGE